MIEKALTEVSAFLFNPNSQQNQKSIHTVVAFPKK